MSLLWHSIPHPHLIDILHLISSLQVGAPVTALILNEAYLAVGTAAGRVHVWQRPPPPPPTSSSSAADGEWRSLVPELGGRGGLVAEPEGSGRPCDTLCLGQAPDGGGLLVSHSASQYRINVWKLVSFRKCVWGGEV